jgi:succinate dehydrogenase/fumarate reductase flavoprotein subunit
MWDHEVDIAVIGFGGAGAAAAITAFDAGAKVIILEKNSSGGGNTQYSGGSIRTYLDVEKAVTFIESVCEGTTGRDVAESFVNESSQNRDWVA